MALDNIHPGRLKQARINGIQARDFVALVVSERIPVKRNALGLPAKARRFAPGGCVLAGIDVEFFRDTAHIDASAAQCGLFYHGYPCPKFGALSGGPDAAGACANDHQVVIKMLSHRFTKTAPERVAFCNFIVMALRLQSSDTQPTNG